MSNYAAEPIVIPTMQSYTRRPAGRLGAGLRDYVRSGIALAVAALRGRARTPDDEIRVSRLSDEWLETYEIESAKHDADF
jgi:hypothetical protein